MSMEAQPNHPDPSEEEIERKCKQFRKHWPARRFPKTAVPARTMEVSMSEFNAVVMESENQ
jgi:hypothetical protein